jgi:hypothetical protein
MKKRKILSLPREEKSTQIYKLRTFLASAYPAAQELNPGE